MHALRCLLDRNIEYFKEMQLLSMGSLVPTAQNLGKRLRQYSRNWVSRKEAAGWSSSLPSTNLRLNGVVMDAIQISGSCGEEEIPRVDLSLVSLEPHWSLQQGYNKTRSSCYRDLVARWQPIF